MSTVSPLSYSDNGIPDRNLCNIISLAIAEKKIQVQKYNSYITTVDLLSNCKQLSLKCPAMRRRAVILFAITHCPPLRDKVKWTWRGTVTPVSVIGCGDDEQPPETVRQSQRPSTYVITVTYKLSVCVWSVSRGRDPGPERWTDDKLVPRRSHSGVQAHPVWPCVPQSGEAPVTHSQVSEDILSSSSTA